MSRFAYNAIDGRYAISVQGDMEVSTYLKTTGKKAAELAREMGVGRGTVHDLKTGRRKPGKKIALKLEAATGKPWWSWMGRS